MKKKKLKLNKDTLLVLESGRLSHVAGGIVAVPAPNSQACSTLCSHFGCPTGNCDTSGCTLGCPQTSNCETSHCPNSTDNCSLGCPTTPQPLP